MFNDGINVYCTDEYSKITLEAYIAKQRGMDDIVNKLIGNKQEKTIIFIGGCSFSPNLRINKYIRTPGIYIKLKKKNHIPPWNSILKKRQIFCLFFHKDHSIKYIFLFFSFHIHLSFYIIIHKFRKKIKWFCLVFIAIWCSLN